jgi:hypothetical protein
MVKEIAPQTNCWFLRIIVIRPIILYRIDGLISYFMNPSGLKSIAISRIFNENSIEFLCSDDSSNYTPV